MPLIDRRTFLRTSVVAGVSAPPLGRILGDARADDKTFVMKLGTATINEAQHEWCKRYAAMVEKDSSGRIKGEVYPASQLGPIPREIEGVQFGAIQGYMGPPEFLVGVDERYEVLSAPGLIDDMAHGIRVASDPELQKLMFSFGGRQGHPWRRAMGFAALVDHLADSRLPSRRPQRQEAARPCRRHATRDAQTPWCLPGGDDLRRCPAGHPTRSDRRRGGRHDGRCHNEDV
jgi:Bacterial extracellular solute-binding protein, family 7